MILHPDSSDLNFFLDYENNPYSLWNTFKIQEKGQEKNNLKKTQEENNPHYHLTTQQ